MNGAAARFAASTFLILALWAPRAHALLIDGGVDNTFVISTWSQTVWGWGGNVGGKLGTGSIINSNMPAPVRQSTNLRLAAGFYHMCAWNTYGLVRCWGRNSNGQLGDNTNVNRSVPADVLGLNGADVEAMTGGSFHTCAVTILGGAKCWGSNFFNQLGDGSGFDSWSPVDVIGLSSGTSSIAAGDHHTCALTTGGAVKCWGENLDGQLGSGNNAAQPTPGTVSGLSSGVTAISSGLYHVCALTTGGAVKCWGKNTNGQLGIGSLANSNVPVSVPMLASNVIAISAGNYHTCAILSNGAAKCWGYNGQGEVGDGTIIQRTSPVDVSGLNTSGSVMAIKAGFNHTCAIVRVSNPGIPIRQVRCWGANAAGEVGDGTTSQRLVPTNLYYSYIPEIGAIEAGGSQNCMVMANTTYSFVNCWGANNYGQLGLNNLTDQAIPQYVDSLSWGYGTLDQMTAVSAGMSHTLAVKSDGTVWAWGANDKGQLGLGWNAAPSGCATPSFGTINCSRVAMRVPGLKDVIAVGAGWGHSLALTEDGTVWAWGDGQFGQTGDQSFGTSYRPRRVSQLSGIQQIAGGYFHNVALQVDGTLIAWGRGDHGQLGNGLLSNSATPVAVYNLSDVTSISSKGSHTLALVGAHDGASGDLYSWGLNAYGQLGTGNGFDQSSPTFILSDVYKASAGMSFSMALRGSSHPFAWGLNTSGQLGTTSGNNCGAGHACAISPIQVGAYTYPQDVTAGGAHAIVTREDESLALFGDNASGQLADKSGDFGVKFAQEIFDPDGYMFPLLTDPSGTAIGAPPSGSGLSRDGLGASIDFGLVVKDTSKSMPLTLTNLDPTAITFSSITFSGAGFSLTHNCPVSPATLASSASCIITPKLTASSVDNFYGTLYIYSNSPGNEILTYGMIGSGATAPSAPTNVVAEAGDQSAIVRFTPPSSSGGPDIDHYTITSIPDTRGFPTVAPPDGFWGVSVPGLQNGTAYTFVVSATNKANLTGLASAPSNTITPKPAPTSVTLTSSQNPSYVGSPVTFSATVSGSLGTPTGTATFYSEGIPIAGCEGVALVSGVAQCGTTPAYGQRSVHAHYSGGPTYSQGYSPYFLQNVWAALLGVDSTRVHDDGNSYTLPIDTSANLNGTITVEPRTNPNGSGYNLLFRFNAPIDTVGFASVTQGSLSYTTSFGSNNVGVSISGLADNNRVTVTLPNINGLFQSISVSVGFLVGDVTSSRSVNGADVTLVKSHAGEAASAANFAYDINRSGAITAADILMAKRTVTMP